MNGLMRRVKVRISGATMFPNAKKVYAPLRAIGREEKTCDESFLLLPCAPLRSRFLEPKIHFLALGN